jgi:hypothetical protein
LGDGEYRGQDKKERGRGEEGKGRGGKEENRMRGRKGGRGHWRIERGRIGGKRGKVVRGGYVDKA